MICLKDFSFSYEGSESWALRDVNLLIAQGSFVGITGACGSGKSTLLRAINGMIPNWYTGKAQGNVIVGSQDVGRVGLTELSRLVGSVLPATALSVLCPVVQDEVAFGLKNLGIPDDRIAARVTEALDLMDITHLRRRMIDTLDEFDRAKVALAAALALRPRVLVMDDSLNAFDNASARRILETIWACARRYEMTVVASGNRPELLADIADRLIILDEGQVAFDGPPCGVPAANGRKGREENAVKPQADACADTVDEDAAAIRIASSDECAKVRESEDIFTGQPLSPLYHPDCGFLTHMNPLAKLLCALLVSVACLCARSIIVLAAVIALELSCAACCHLGRTGARLAGGAALVSLPFALIALLACLISGASGACSWNDIAMGGARAAAITIGIMIGCALPFGALFATTKPNDMAQAASVALHIPYQYALHATIALWSVPRFLERVCDVRRSVRRRDPVEQDEAARESSGTRLRRRTVFAQAYRKTALCQRRTLLAAEMRASRNRVEEDSARRTRLRWADVFAVLAGIMLIVLSAVSGSHIL